MNAWNTVVIEDQTLFRELLVKMLREDARYRLVGEASDGPSGLALCRETKPEMIVLDLQLPFMDGFQLSEKLSAELPEARILALTSLNDEPASNKPTMTHIRTSRLSMESMRMIK